MRRLKKRGKPLPWSPPRDASRAGEEWGVCPFGGGHWIWWQAIGAACYRCHHFWAPGAFPALAITEPAGPGEARDG